MIKIGLILFALIGSLYANSVENRDIEEISKALRNFYIMYEKKIKSLENRIEILEKQISYQNNKLIDDVNSVNSTSNQIKTIEEKSKGKIYTIIDKNGSYLYKTTNGLNEERIKLIPFDTKINIVSCTKYAWCRTEDFGGGYIKEFFLKQID